MTLQKLKVSTVTFLKSKMKIPGLFKVNISYFQKKKGFMKKKKIQLYNTVRVSSRKY